MPSHSRSTAVGRILSTITAMVLAFMLVGASRPQPVPALGSTITVDTLAGTLADDSACSLAEAITNANNDLATYDDCLAGTPGELDTINFDASLKGTVFLVGQLPTITDSDGLTIENDGAITVDGVGQYVILQVDAPATIQGLTVSNGNNSAGSGSVIVGASGALTFRDGVFYGNEADGLGGAIYNGGTLTVERSTFWHNDAGSAGGAIYNLGTATISNSTFAFNGKTYGGGSVHSAGVLTLHNSTIAEGTASSDTGVGSGLHVAVGTANVYNSILANSSFGVNCYAAGGTTVNGNNNLIEDPSPSCGFADGVNGSILNVDPDFASLVGTPAYYVLSTRSPAIDVGSNGSVGGATLDQTGASRFDDVPWVIDGAGTAPIVDIGAYEYPFECPALSVDRLFVDSNSTAVENGSSWTYPYHDLQVALKIVEVCPSPDEIWVADGLYKPDGADPGERGLSFSIPAGAMVYGGFAGGETDLGDRDPAANIAVLSGDVDGDDLNGDLNNIAELYSDIQNNNSYHVVVFDGRYTDITPATVLDGFTVTAGKADGPGLQGQGAGVLVNASLYGAVASPTLNNLVISGNLALFGGGMNISVSSTGVSSSTLTDITFIGNRANGSPGNGGGALVSSFGDSAYVGVEFRNVTFENNSATGRGGAVQIAANYGTTGSTFANVTFHGNSADVGGATSAWSLGTGSVQSEVFNATFTQNSANKGGAIGNDVEATGSAVSSLTNVILWDDTVSGIGATSPEIYNEGTGTTNIAYSVVEGSLPGGIWDTSLGTDGGNNIDFDPLLDVLADNGGATETIALLTGSSAIDAGNDTTCTDPNTVNSLDQRGIQRPSGAHCEIGAFEVQEYAISGNAGIAGAQLAYEDEGSQTALADSGGAYSLWVPPGWSGTVTPSKADYLFDPASRSYSNVAADMANEDYTAFLDAPMILHVYPTENSVTCLMPAVGVNLQLNDLVRTGTGSFDVTKVTLKLDGVPVTGLARISETKSSPANQALILYTPLANLAAAAHQGSFIYPTPLGDVTYNWNFTTSGITCPMSQPVPPDMQPVRGATLPAREAASLAPAATRGSSSLQSKADERITEHVPDDQTASGPAVLQPARPGGAAPMVSGGPLSCLPWGLTCPRTIIIKD